MGVVILFIVLFIGAMILYSIFNKDERERIKKGVESSNQRKLKEESMAFAEEISHTAVNEQGIDGLVGMIQMVYSANNMKAEVTHNGSELIVNMLDDDPVSLYYDTTRILENRHEYSQKDISEANEIFNFLKQDVVNSVANQPPKERELYRKAGVKKYTVRIDGNHINTIDFYY